MIETGVKNFLVYENAVEFLGMAEVKLPEVAFASEDTKGAGLNGVINAVYSGNVEAMSIDLTFRTVTDDVLKLAGPQNHQLDLRASQQRYNKASGLNEETPVKYVIMGVTNKFDPGKLAPSSSADASVSLSLTYFACYIDGEKKMEIDILNYICFINGVDYCEKTRKALGK